MISQFLISYVALLQEVCRIRNEHPGDPSAISKDRVKGSLKVTRAFGAGFLKQVSLYLITSVVHIMNLFIDDYDHATGLFIFPKKDDLKLEG
jgi:hypothetical protein